MPRMAVVLLFGIPGSGKSTLAQEISRRSAQTCHDVSFDALENDLDWDESSFKKLRKDSLERIRAITHSSPFATANDSDEFPGLILVDDIMYLRSMRREVYVIARDCNIPIIVVWVNTPLEVALERNGQRSGKQRIEEQTIIKLHAALEPPDAQHICDRVHLVIDGACEGSINRGIDTILSQAPDHWLKRKQEEHLQRQISESSTQPSAECNVSILKDLDTMLRNIVAYAMKLAAARAMTKQFTQALGAAFATAKTHILSEARSSPCRDSCEQADEMQQAWMRGLCLKLIAVVERTMAGDRDNSDSAEINDILDRARIFIAEKFPC